MKCPFCPSMTMAFRIWEITKKSDHNLFEIILGIVWIYVWDVACKKESVLISIIICRATGRSSPFFVFITFTQPVKDWNLIDLLKLQEKLSKVIRYISFWRELFKTLNLMVKSFINQINKWRIYKICTLSYIRRCVFEYLQLSFNYSLINSNSYSLEQIKFK